MSTISLPGPCLALEVRELLSARIGVDVSSIELYIRGDKGLVAVPDELWGTREYYVLLRFRGSKGGFRKQLEKKGRAYARARRLRESNQSNARPQKVQNAGGTSEKSIERKGTETTVREPKGEDKIQPNAVLNNTIRNAVRLGVKRTLESLADNDQ
ncbi:hypothetical protein DQ04_04211060 [Trypanosoma grayi]|uniref:hypothetical protein n=1 Tax=Trypanosoma grayi TaxID=71804 RepID=UPI0004F427A5|nr:hypothetical protein DQ04_04211060 [Trypanosoma grayi]KEG10082.1 hypothetical protein DQ04_04211060 [Trypanosoma grayi]